MLEMKQDVNGTNGVETRERENAKYDVVLRLLVKDRVDNR